MASEPCILGRKMRQVQQHVFGKDSKTRPCVASAQVLKKQVEVCSEAEESGSGGRGKVRISGLHPRVPRRQGEMSTDRQDARPSGR